MNADKAQSHEDARREAGELLHKLSYYSLMNRNAGLRKSRQEELMSRRVARTWDAAKKSKMVRRLMRANQELEQSTVAIGEIERRLEVLVAQHRLSGPVAPYTTP